MTTPSQQYNYSTTVQPGPLPGIGIWSFTLDPVEANVTVNIYVSSKVGLLSLTNVIFGDVWICSGQSNMQLTVIQVGICFHTLYRLLSWLFFHDFFLQLHLCSYAQPSRPVVFRLFWAPTHLPPKSHPCLFPPPPTPFSPEISHLHESHHQN